MKKRILSVVIFAVAVLALAGCTKKEDSTFGFKPDGASVTLVPGEKFESQLADIGETIGYMEAASCYYDGLDKIFTYDGYEVTTYPAGDGDYIQDINISSDSYKTDKGIGVGSTLAQVEASYGTDYEMSGRMYQYTQENGKYIYFFIMNDVVKYYGYAIEVK